MRPSVGPKSDEVPEATAGKESDVIGGQLAVRLVSGRGHRFSGYAGVGDGPPLRRVAGPLPNCYHS